MESSVVDQAFSMWKGINDFAETVLKPGCIDNVTIQKLANMVMSKEFSKTFLYIKEPGISLDRYKEILDMYQTFTTWLIEQFFYLLGCDDDVIIVEAQLSILKKLSETHLYVYVDLCKEYCKAFEILTNYLKHPNKDKIIIKVFELKPNQQLERELRLKENFIELSDKNMCLGIIKRIIKILEFILIESIKFYNVNINKSFKALENLAYVLSQGYFPVEIFEVFINLLPRLVLHKNDWNINFLTICRLFCSLFEQFIYDFYNNNNPNGIDQTVLETLLLNYLKSPTHNEMKITNNSKDIKLFIIKHFLKEPDELQLYPCWSIQEFCLNNFNHPLNSLCNDVNQLICLLINKNPRFLLKLLENYVFKEICDYYNENSVRSFINIYECSQIWSTVQEHFNNLIRSLQCTQKQSNCGVSKMCQLIEEIIIVVIEINVKFQRQSCNFCKLIFLNEDLIFPKILANVAAHYSTTCKHNIINLVDVLKMMVQFLLTAECKNIEIVYHLIACTILFPLCYKSAAQLPSNYIGDPFTNKQQLRNDLSSCYNHILNDKKIKTIEIVPIINDFIKWLSSGLLRNLIDEQLDRIGRLHVKIVNYLLKSEDINIKLQIIETIPESLIVFPNKEEIFSIFLSLLILPQEIFRSKLIEIIRFVLCSCSSDFIKILKYDRTLTMQCIKCDFNGNLQNVDDYLQDNPSFTAIPWRMNQIDVVPWHENFLKIVINSLKSSNHDTVVKTLSILPNISKHIKEFHTIDVTKIWIELASVEVEEIRKKLTNVVYSIINNAENFNKPVLETIFTILLKLTKNALQWSNHNLQATLVSTISEIARLDNDFIKFESMKILIYLIMVPTSSQSAKALNRCMKLSKKDVSGKLLIYKQNAKDICKIIAHLCYVNQHIVNFTLQESMCKVVVMLGFDDVKSFVTSEVELLVPYLVAKIVQNPAQVSKLISEMASLMDIETMELLSQNYGGIFLHLHMENYNEKDTEICENYVERTTGISGRKLRNMNFKVIINKLLLSFHEKRKDVLKILNLLRNADTKTCQSIEDYLQPFFLGFLLHFHLELTSDYLKDEAILLSLADLLVFLGATRIMPFRFKIISVLQTSHYLKHEELTCKLWNSFLKNCDIACMGPQLATIFCALLPLIKKCSNYVNKLFYYLIIENQSVMQKYIADLFFVNSPYLYPSILEVIKNFVKPIETLPVKDKIKKYLTYLQHDTLEVRIQSLKQLKICLEANRETIDRMILGYNGMDDTIVELIDSLTIGCRHNNATLRLACAEVFGELGAIEPSHLPRRYAQNNNTFTFFMTDDAFIENALNELLKTFQTDKDARNTDRVALAIQEILRIYEISPSIHSPRNSIWQKFSDSQKEVMTPLLSSKYICVENFIACPSPLYGSMAGASAQTWLYNWTANLIISLPDDKKTLLQSCYPSMKLDRRVLMHFLPYILLHSLLENTDKEKTYLEFLAVLNSFNSKRSICQEVLDRKPLAIQGSATQSRDITTEEEKQIQCSKVIFVLLDFLDRWLRECEWAYGQSAGLDLNYQNIKKFVQSFCTLKLAKCNYQCGEYPRALIYLEEFMANNPDQIAANLEFLTKIYAQLDESDAVGGIEMFQDCEPSIEQKVLFLQVSGKLADAATIYEHMPRPLQLHHLQGLMQCYLDLDEVNTALSLTASQRDLQPYFGSNLLEMQFEPLWRLGSYDDLDKLLNSKSELVDNRSWPVQIGRSLIHMKNGDRNEFKLVLDSIKKQQIDAFAATSLEEGAYQHGYNHIMRLHCLNELDQLEKVIYDLLIIKPNDKNYAEMIMTKLENEWQLRMKVVQESVKIVEPLLCLRRVGLNLGKSIIKRLAPQNVSYFDQLLGECWLQSVNISRSAGIQQAYTYILEAEKYKSSKFFLEKAKLHWQREEHNAALLTLKRGLNFFIPENATSQETQLVIAQLTPEKKKLCAEARLLIATYNDTISSVDIDFNLQLYKDSVEIHKEWETSIVHLAQYQERILQNYPDDEKDSRASELQLHIIHNFGRSLFFGTNHIYQSMPRLLSIWFDYGTRLLDVTDTDGKDARKNTLMKMTKLIDNFLQKLPAFIFLTSFSQIISRISHPQKEVYIQLKSIIVTLLQKYPQHCLWMISSVIKSSYPIRAKRCAEILNDPRLKIESINKLIKDFTSLTEKLIEVCNREIPKDINQVTVSAICKTLPRMLARSDFSQIMMPIHKYRKLVLPNPDFTSSQHNPFPNHYVHIIGIENEIVILPSLQKPRKIILRGSDGHSYTFILKARDDLRKDFRLMEFNDIVNHLLLRAPEARQRRLNIRLYSVAPLNEECGLIEWVPNLIGLRLVLLNLYKQKGLGMRQKDIKDVCCQMRDPLAKKKEVFKNVFLKKFPPVLAEWFRKTFPDAQSWLTARNGYIRTTAVISLTGYILGLGDRHGENILLDSTSGDVVHVDFNCLFNKGETFEWPERVPFRLTQNMVSAMGPLGVEGVFRKSCELTLRVLRSNRTTLMSIVTPFVYDPLVSWPRYAATTAHSSERINDQAVEHIKNIDLRLQGKVKTRSRTLSQCLSVEGQTNYLINEAMSIDNLCQMYIGWGPYL